MSLGVVIIGLGRIGLGYDLDLDPRDFVMTHARAFGTDARFHLLGAIDPDPNRRGIFQARYRSPAFATVAEAFGLQPDMVVLALPTRLHAAALQEALAAWQPAIVLCEKPLASDRTEAEAMLEACRRRRVRLLVNYMRRAEPAVCEVAARLADGRIQAPVKGTAWYSKGLVHNGSHLVNLLAFWLGGVEGADLIDRGRDAADGDAEPDFVLRCAAGRVVFLAAREESFSLHTVELVSPSGRLRYDQGGEIVTWQQAAPHPELIGYRELTPPESLRPDLRRAQAHVADALAATASTGRPEARLCTGEQALGTLEPIWKLIQQR